MGDGKIYKDILDTVENANLSERKISNIFKNAYLEETDCISNKNNNKIKIPNNVYIFKLMGPLNLCEKIKKRVENKIFLSTMHVGVDEKKSTKNRKKWKIKKAFFKWWIKIIRIKMINLILIILLIKFFKSMDTYDINEDTKILILSDGEKQIKKIYIAIKTKYKNNTV